MSAEFMRKYPRMEECMWCNRFFTKKGIKQHQRKCRCQFDKLKSRPPAARRREA